MSSNPAASESRLPDALLKRLRELAPALDAPTAWPGEQFRLLAEAGVLREVIPTEFGGTDVSATKLLETYLTLSAACLTTAFVLTQRNGACQRIAASENEALRAELLPRLAAGELFATVGISHLTTSRQHWSAPAVSVEPTCPGLVFRGNVPWVTGASHADFIVTGGTLTDGRQLLAAIPTTLPGVEIEPAAQLLALTSSQTASVQLNDVVLDERWLVAGPIEQVMKHGPGGGTGSLATSALAVGLSRAAIDHMRVEAEKRENLRGVVASLDEEAGSLAATILQQGAGQESGETAESIRGHANSLALRSTQALLAASKGAGFVSGHFAERAVREAMFFLVWSCPQPVVNAALRELAGISECS